MKLEKYMRWKDAAEFAEGVSAANEGKHFKDFCPYTYAETGEQFNRDKLDAFFAGWYVTTESRIAGTPQPPDHAQEEQP